MLKMKYCLVLLVLVYLVSSQQNVNEQCIGFVPFYGDLCVITSLESCYLMTTKVKLGNQIVLNRTTSVLQFVYDNQDNLNASNCVKFGRNNCQMCFNSRNFTIGENLNICGDIYIDCNVNGLKINRTYDISCYNVSDCTLFGCPNSCSNKGTCNKNNLCVCNESYYGPDCSIGLTNSTISAPFLDSPVSFSATIEKCDFNLKITQYNFPVVNVHQDINRLRELEVYQCQNSNLDSNCSYCLTMGNFSILSQKEIRGCVYAKYNCLNHSLYNYKLGCQSFISENNILDCFASTITNSKDTTKPYPSSSRRNEYTTTSKSSSSKTSTDGVLQDSISIAAKATLVVAIIIVIVVILAILIVKWKGSAIDYQYKQIVNNWKKNQIQSDVTLE